MTAACDPVRLQSVEATVLLPEEPVSQLGVKSSGLYFLTAGDQGVLGRDMGSGMGLGKACGPESQQPCPHPHRHSARVGGSFRAVCVHAGPATGPRAGADSLHPGPDRRPAPQRHRRPQPVAL